jgi:hypothetical protein
MANESFPVGDIIEPPKSWYTLQQKDTLGSAGWLDVGGYKVFDEEVARAEAYKRAQENMTSYRVVQHNS